MSTPARQDANPPESAMSLAELIQLAEVLQTNGREQEAVQVYRHWLDQSQDEQRFWRGSISAHCCKSSISSMTRNKPTARVWSFGHTWRKPAST
jgi:hypothetical protein